MFETISVIGGDMRQLTLAEELKKEGYRVSLYGFDKESEKGCSEASLTAALDSDIIVLPVPVSFDGVKVNMPYAGEELSMKALMDNINPASLVFGGKLQEEARKALESKGILFRDYMSREELAVKNAIPTAEGAIEIAMSELPITLHGSKCLVMGYGKVGKILSEMLNGLGAQTYVEARKYADLAMIEGHGCEAVPLCELHRRISEFDVIFNTVPSVILTENILNQINTDTPVIDLASKPGGVDFEAAKKLGVKVIWALSLPGKVAPVTSGRIIKDTILNILSELGV